MYKFALNRYKLEKLVKLIGIVPSTGTNWKGALKKFFVKNKEGNKFKNLEDLIVNPRQVRLIKEKVFGILPNNIKNKLQKEVLKNKGAETALLKSKNDDKLYFISGTNKSIDINPQLLKDYILLAHTHPKTTVTEYTKKKEKLNKFFESFPSQPVLDHLSFKSRKPDKTLFYIIKSKIRKDTEPLYNFRKVNKNALNLLLNIYNQRIPKAQKLNKMKKVINDYNIKIEIDKHTTPSEISDLVLFMLSSKILNSKSKRFKLTNNESDYIAALKLKNNKPFVIYNFDQNLISSSKPLYGKGKFKTVLFKLEKNK